VRECKAGAFRGGVQTNLRHASNIHLETSIQQQER
jgi:hypothetical protein